KERQGDVFQGHESPLLLATVASISCRRLLVRCRWASGRWSALFGLDPGGFEYWPPSVDLCLLKRAERCRSLLIGFGYFLAQVGKSLRQPGSSLGLDCRVVNLRDDAGRSPLGHPEAVPDGDVQARQARFIDCRDFGCRGKATPARHRIGLDLPRAHVRKRIRR